MELAPLDYIDKKQNDWYLKTEENIGDDTHAANKYQGTMQGVEKLGKSGKGWLFKVIFHARGEFLKKISKNSVDFQNYLEAIFYVRGCHF